MECPFLAIQNLYQSIWGKMSGKKIGMAIFGCFKECNGLEGNEICTFLDFYSTVKQIHTYISNEKFFEIKLSGKHFYLKKSLKKIF